VNEEKKIDSPEKLEGNGAGNGDVKPVEPGAATVEETDPVVLRKLLS